MDHILEPHQATMVERCQLEEGVLAIQDTTSLNYQGLEATGGLVGIGGGGGKGVRGLWAHVGLAVNAAWRPLGVFSLDATYCDGDGAESASVRWQRGLDRAQELARACPATRVVTVCPGGRHVGLVRQGGIARRRAAGACAPVDAAQCRRGNRREAGPVGPCRRAPASCVQDRGGRRLRRQAGAARAQGKARPARRQSEAGTTVAPRPQRRAPGANRCARRDRNRTQSASGQGAPCTGCC